MKNSGLIIFSLLMLSLGINRVQAQQAGGSFLVSAGLDLVRSDLNQAMERAQFGGEVNYFYLHHVSFSGGYEYNLNRPNQVTGGIRWYPLEPVFIRARALVGNEADMGVGLGYTHNFTYRMRLESMVDYYIHESTLGARVAIAVLIN